MIKTIKSLVTIGLLFGTFSIIAQSSINNRLSISGGVGLVPTFVGENATVNTPPVSVRIAYRVSPAFQLSGYAGYSSSTSSSPFLISDGIQSLISNKQTMLGLRGELRKDLNDKVDVYGGALFGYKHTEIREFNKNSNETIIREPGAPTPFNPNQPNEKFLYAGFVGATYFFTKNIGLFAEAGYGISLLNTGITVKI